MTAADHTTQPRHKLLKPIVMVGMMGAGKTAIGSALADRLDVAFKDSDAEIVEAASRSIAEIFERDGEAFFRARESEVIARLLSEEPCILSTGGGAFLAETNRDIIDATAVSVWLKADTSLLWSRVRHKTTRPLLQTSDPKATLTELAEARNPIYAKAALAVEAQAEFSIEDMVDKVLAALTESGIVKELN